MKRDAALFFLLLISLAVAPGQGKIIRVPQQYRTIQAGINAATNGDTVLVAQGLYYENIRYRGKKITVASLFILDHDTVHIAKTIIDGSRPRILDSTSTVTFDAGTDTNSVISGFTVRGGSGTRISTEVPGRFYIMGGGILSFGGGARISNNMIAQNRVVERDTFELVNGGGIDFWSLPGTQDPRFGIVEDNVISRNSAFGALAAGGGININHSGRIVRNRIWENISSAVRGVGGGISVGGWWTGTVMISENFITHNISGRGAGIAAHAIQDLNANIPGKYAATVIVANNIIAENRAEERGGGVHCEVGLKIFMVNNTIVNNDGGVVGGGANFSGSFVEVLNNILWNNKPDQIASFDNHRVSHNLIEGGYPGRGNIDHDPLFAKGDPFFRIEPGSPAIGAGLDSTKLFDVLFLSPASDFFGTMRPSPPESKPDLGAVESPESQTAVSFRIREEQEESRRRSAKLSLFLRRTDEPGGTSDNRRMPQRGLMDVLVALDDVFLPSVARSERDLIVYLPPDRNLLEIEILTDSVPQPQVVKGFQFKRMLMANYWLKGSDQRITQIYFTRYVRYSDLKPGEYTFILQSTDENQYFNPANRVSIPITVLPPWWQTPWAYAGYVLSAAGMVIIGWRVRIRRLRLEQQLTREQFQTEQFAKVDRLKSRFFANISHEFRTPLTLILGPLEQLLLETREQKPKERLSLVHRNATKLLGLINQLLDFAKLESGSMALAAHRRDLVPFLNGIIQEFQSLAEHRGIVLVFDHDADHMVAYFDPDKFEKILNNLLSNAIKFTPEGGRVGLSLGQKDETVVISVRDTGSGIGNEHLPHIFERFYRGDDSGQVEGTGIGLALTKELVELHGATIEVESEQGNGSIFTIRLPRGRDQLKAGEIAEEQVEPVVSFSSFENNRSSPVGDREKSEFSFDDDSTLPVVLIVEDNPEVRSYIRGHLENEYRVLDANNGREGLEKAIEQVPDLVISDVMMPAMDGFEFCKRIKTDERTSHIPVILLTARASQESKLDGLETGADDYLVKPFDANELIVRIRNLIENRRRMHEHFAKQIIELRPGQIAVSNMDEAFVKKVMEAVERNMAEENFSVEQLAREVSMSYTQLHRKLRALTDLSAGQIIRRFRLQRAMELLKQNAGTVSEIAFTVGFGSPAYFTKCFREEFGILPSDVSKSDGIAR